MDRNDSPQEPTEPDIQALFLKALDLPTAERDAFLAEQCVGDSSKLQAVRHLLDAAEASEGFMEGLSLDQSQVLYESLRGPLQSGHQVGPYTIDRELGRGGMGVVYLAHRSDGQFEQRVALKILKLGMDSETILEGFLRERQILAWMRHEGIAQLYDGGLSEDGRPYFAMEYIPGEPITDYCDSRRLSIPERLELFRRAAKAVQHAHRNLVVHRDLKPSNILVTENGEVKLLDFGIAKMMDDGPAQRTRTGFRAMTPESASPEQLLGEPVTTATDIYALGLILYELLTGRRPFHFPKISTAEMGQRIRQETPTRPSHAITRGGVEVAAESTPAPSAEERSQLRNARPDRLRRMLSGDLDTIVLTALQADPARRYASVESMIEDLERHEGGLPVRARPDTFLYRSGKYLRRNAGAVAATTIIFLLLLAFGIGSRMQQRTTARERDKLAQVNDFVLGIFEAANPELANFDDAVTARDLLDVGVERIDRELTGQPQIRAEMLATMGTAYRWLGDYDQAEPLLREALQLREREFGQRSPEVAASVAELGILLRLQGKDEDWEGMYRRSLEIWRELHPGDDPNVSGALRNLAGAYLAAGRYADADSVAALALEMDLRLHGEEDIAVTQSRVVQANAKLETGDSEGAATLYQASLDRYRDHYGGDHIKVAGLLSNLGMAQGRLSRFEEAASNLRASLQMETRLLGEDSPTLISALNNLSDVLGSLGAHAEAETLARRSLELRREQLGDDHTDIATGLNNLGAILMRQGKMDEAQDCLERSLAINQKVLGRHPRVGVGMLNLGVFLRNNEKFEQSLELHRESLPILLETLGPEHPLVGTAKTSLATTLRLLDQNDEALELYGEALELLRAKYPPNSTRIADCAVEYGKLLRDIERPGEAEPLLREAVEIYAEALPEEHSLRSTSASALGSCLSMLERYDEAEALLLPAYERLGLVEADSTKRRGTAELLVEHYERRGMSAEAERYREPPR